MVGGIGGKYSSIKHETSRKVQGSTNEDYGAERGPADSVNGGCAIAYPSAILDGVNDNKMAKAKVEEPVGFAVVDCVWMSVAANGDSEIAAPWTGAPVGWRRGRLSIGS